LEPILFILSGDIFFKTQRNWGRTVAVKKTILFDYVIPSR